MMESFVFDDFMLLLSFFFFFSVGLHTIKGMSLIFMCFIKVKAEFHFSFFRYSACVLSLVVFLAFSYFLMKQGKKITNHWYSNQFKLFKSSQASFFLNYFSLSTVGNTVLLDVKPCGQITIVISNFLDFM